MNTPKRYIPVWDPLIRVFHWGLVLAFFLAWVTGDDWDSLHRLAGYTLAGLLCFRLLWGLVGTPYARFSQFLYGPQAVADYLKSLTTAAPKHYTGHNPAGAWMVFGLLLLLTALTATGILMDQFATDLFEDLHEGLANFTLFLVGVHVAGVIVSSVLHRENLIRAMVTGYKPARASVPDQDNKKPLDHPVGGKEA